MVELDETTMTVESHRVKPWLLVTIAYSRSRPDRFVMSNCGIAQNGVCRPVYSLKKRDGISSPEVLTPH